MPKTKMVPKSKIKAQSKKAVPIPVKKVLRRPWQGTLLGVLAGIDAGATFLLSLFLLFGTSFMENFFGEMLLGSGRVFSTMGMRGMMPGGFSGSIFTMALFLFAAALLDFFIARGFLRGEFWAVVFTSIFVGLGALASFFQIFYQGMNMLGFSFVFVHLLGLAYLCYACWISPFYRRK